jgi:hypothetical protein
VAEIRNRDDIFRQPNGDCLTFPADGLFNETHLMKHEIKKARQNVPSIARVAAGAFGFLTLI